MTFTSYLAKRLRAVAAFALLAAITSTVAAQSTLSVSNPKPAERTFNLLVLGDSIMWGQGLRDEHKAWFHIKSWLQQNAGRDVREYVQAHSGAVVGSPDDAPVANQLPIDGEVAVGSPTINQELSRALSAYGDPAQVDLVLIDGCINDVNVLNLLNGGNSPEEISQLVTSKCGAPMEVLLSRVARSFPSAHIIVTGYYPVISEKTPDSLLLRFVARTFYRSSPQGPKLSGKQLRERLIDLSRSWHEVSSGVLKAAVSKTNAELAARSSRQRAIFVEVPFRPEYSFSAPETRLWGFHSSFLRKLLTIISLGRIPLKTDDERLNQRVASCKEFYKRPASEDAQDKKTRELRRTLCRYASLGHPNRKGALIYSEAIIDQLKLVAGDIGWLRLDNRLAMPAAAGP